MPHSLFIPMSDVGKSMYRTYLHVVKTSFKMLSLNMLCPAVTMTCVCRGGPIGGDKQGICPGAHGALPCIGGLGPITTMAGLLDLGPN